MTDQMNQNAPVPPLEAEKAVSFAKENAVLMKKSFHKLILFLLTMTIAVWIVILKQGEPLFLFNFSSNNMNSVSTFWIFRGLMSAFLMGTFLYLVYFSTIYAKRTRWSLEQQQISYPAFQKRYEVFDLLAVVPMFLAVFLTITGFFLSPAVVEGPSMEPNYYNDDTVIIYSFLETYHSDDVVIVDLGTELLIKRLIAVPGDLLKVDETGVYVNGEFKEAFIPVHSVPDQGLVPYFVYDGILPEGKYFVMGDNRLNSTDGRRFGLIDADQLLGIVIIP
jgi:signal peptidase I